MPFQDITEFEKTHGEEIRRQLLALNNEEEVNHSLGPSLNQIVGTRNEQKESDAQIIVSTEAGNVCLRIIPKTQVVVESFTVRLTPEEALDLSRTIAEAAVHANNSLLPENKPEPTITLPSPLFDVLFMSIYGDQTGCFAAKDAAEAWRMAWDGIEQLVENPDKTALLIRLATDDDIAIMRAAKLPVPAGQVVTDEEFKVLEVLRRKAKKDVDNQPRLW